MRNAAKRLAVWMFLVLIAGFYLRVDYRLGAIDETPLRADGLQYFVIAWNVVQHSTFSTKLSDDERPPEPDSYRGPLYPLLVAGVIASVGDHVGDVTTTAYHRLLFLQAVLGALVATGVVVLGRRWLPRSGAVVAGALCAIWPVLITLSGAPLTETLFSALLMAGVVMLALYVRRPATSTLIIAALAWGACVLVNPVALPLPFVLGVVAFGKRVRLLALFLVIALTLPAMWSVRNSSIPNADARVTSSGRLLENVLIGLEPDFNDYYQQPDQASGDVARERFQEMLDAYAAGQRSMPELILARIREEPGAIAAHFVQKPWKFWRWGIEQGYGGPHVYMMLVSPFESHPLYVGIAKATYWLNPLLFVLGFVPCLALLLSAQWRRWAWEHRVPLLVLAVMLYATAVHTLLTPDARYAAPFRPMQFLCAAWGGWIIGRAWLTRLRGGRPVTMTESTLPAPPPA